MILIVVVAIGGGIYVYRLWEEQDKLLRETIISSIAEKLPHWDVSIGHARFDWSRRIHVHNVELRVPGEKAPLISVPEIVVIVDQERLANDQTVVIEHIDIHDPRLTLRRYPEGTWSYEKLLPVPPSDASLPDWNIINATINLQLDHSEDTSADVMLTGLNAEFTSSGKRRVSFTSTMHAENVGQVRISGETDLTRKEWTLRGQVAEMSVNDDLVRYMAELSPEVRSSLWKLDQKLSKLSEPDSAAPPIVQVAMPGQTSDAGDEATELTVPSINGGASLDFRLTKLGPDAALEYKVLLELSQTEFSSPYLPVPFRGVSGKLFADANQLIIKEFSARHGATHLKVDGTLKKNELGKLPAALFVRIEELELNEALSSRLPASWKRMFDMIQPQGSLDVSTELSFDGVSRWSFKNLNVIPKSCTAAHAAFPYPIQNIKGVVKQREDRLDLDYDLTGQAGHRKVSLKGHTLNLGPAAENHFDVSVNGLPINRTFLEACKPEVRKTLEAMKLEAACDIRAVFHKDAGLNERFSQRISADVHQGAVQCDFFPVRLDRLSGKVSFNSGDGLWIFSDLAARHGETSVEGAGFYDNVSGPGELDLTLTVKNGHFDRTLEHALPEGLQLLWEQLSPKGKFHCLTKVHWHREKGVDIAFPAVHIFDAGLELAALPVPLEKVDAKLSYKSPRLEIKSFSARHDHCRIRGKGFAEVYPDQWRVRFDKMFIDDLVPDRVFRLALPDSLREAVESLDPQGKLSISGIVDFRGTTPPEDIVTAFWNIKTVLSGARLWAGMDLDQVHGTVTAIGTWDGFKLRNTGKIELDSLEVLDHQLTQIRGPYQIQDQQLVVGSKRILSPNHGQVELKDRLTAKAIGGQLTLDTVARLGESPSFHSVATLSSGYLEEYARLYLPGQNNLRGLINGWIDLHGRAVGGKEITTHDITGEGQLQISPASLYELPVLVQVFKVLSFVPPDRTAFNYARVDFDVERSAFWFRTIDLVGDAISLRGKGSARFDGRLDLDFFSMLGRNASTNLPVFNVLINTATTGWVGVAVEGRVESPRARLKVVPTIDDTLRRFLGNFNPGARPPIPRLVPRNNLTGRLLGREPAPTRQ